ncbi:MAG TPA: prephenate dehydrogenase/arogenate dehydrogenase family protein [Candidatus Desulfofervidus auxilii]|uniref:Prephenate dehydrogenase/arogenate dehydrogenase family protein n=1 Tax=Desulfofervidus auxilii TaxID=1621989 RepID=A0A7C0U3X1_DESA2|nr:prephenate dehydrogenase/arogenate dehydrogenase family protein [Candidatus Desulfofervidus auxilii]
MKTPKTIGIIGGTGRMGQWFKDFFEKKGYEVLSASRKTTLSPQTLAEKCDVVIISVPIDVTVETIKKIGPFVRKDALLMDLTSLKKAPVEAMLKYSKAEVIGTHPLFGPGVESLNEQVIVICPARGKNWLPWVKEIFSEAKLEITTPEEHDAIMAVVQALPHFLLLAMGLTLAELPFANKAINHYATPTFQTIWERIKNLAKQNPKIYASIQFENPFYQKEVFPLLCQSIHVLKNIIENQDKKNFVEIFEKIFQLTKKLND